MSRLQLLHWHNRPTCDIVNYDCSSRVSDVAWNEASKSLLPRSVPQLQPDLLSREVMRKQTLNSKKKKKVEMSKKWQQQKRKSYICTNIKWEERIWRQIFTRSEWRHWESADKALTGRGWINNHSLLVTNTPLFDQVKRIILKHVKEIDGGAGRTEGDLVGCCWGEGALKSKIVGQLSREHDYHQSAALYYF